MSLIDYMIDETIFALHTLSFKVPATDLKTKHLVEDAMLRYEDQVFFITDVVRVREANVAEYEVIAEAAWMRLADIKRPGNFTLTGKTPAEGLQEILFGTPWTVRQAPTDATVYSMDATDATVLDLLWQWAKVTVNEISFETLERRVNFLPQIGAIKPLAFRYGRNLQSVKRAGQAPSVTRLYAYGRNDLDVSNSTTGGAPYIENYTYYTSQGLTLLEARELYRKDDVYSDDSFIDESSLYNAAVARLAVLSQPSVTYEISVIDLSKLTNTADYDFQCGDTVRVFDEVLNIDVEARVTRKKTYPYEPQKNEIELTYGQILMPESKSTNARSDRTKEWELFVSHNEKTQRRIRNFSTILHRIQLDTIEGAEWAVNYKLEGLGVGTGNVTIEFTNDTTGLPMWPSRTFAVIPGQQIDIQWTFGEKEVPTGEHILVVRAYSDTPGMGVNIYPKGASFWILARGSTRQNVTLTNSIRFDYTGALQTFTVPDDISEVLIEANGSSGSRVVSTNVGGGLGAMVKGKFPVLGGEKYDVLVGGQSGGRAGGYPDGGSGGGYYGSEVTGAGGSSQVRPLGGSLATALLVAAGGGGSGSGNSVPNQGGDGGFYEGTEPGYGHSLKSTEIGIVFRKATQDIPGLRGWNANYGPQAGWTQTGEDGDTDGVGQGGDVPSVTNAFAYDGGGGGGGWHGGGSGGAGDAAGLTGGGGGGGSGWFNSTVGYDMEIEDASTPPATSGYIIISWENPDL